MDEKKPTPETEENNAPQVDLVDAEPIKAAMEGSPVPTANASVSTKRSMKFTIIAILVVVVALLGVVYLLEKDGRIESGIFSGMIASNEASSAAVTVNGVDVTNDQLSDTMDQLAQTAAAQGANPADPAVMAEIRTQALDLVIGTELLMQAAALTDDIASPNLSRSGTTRCASATSAAGASRPFLMVCERCEMHLNCMIVQTDGMQRYGAIVRQT